MSRNYFFRSMRNFFSHARNLRWGKICEPGEGIAKKPPTRQLRNAHRDQRRGQTCRRRRRSGGTDVKSHIYFSAQVATYAEDEILRHRDDETAKICQKNMHVIKFSKRSPVRQIWETSIGQGRFIFTLAFAEFVRLAGEAGEEFWTHGIASNLSCRVKHSLHEGAAAFNFAACEISSRSSSCRQFFFSWRLCGYTGRRRCSRTAAATQLRCAGTTDQASGGS